MSSEQNMGGFKPYREICSGAYTILRVDELHGTATLAVTSEYGYVDQYLSVPLSVMRLGSNLPQIKPGVSGDHIHYWDIEDEGPCFSFDSLYD